MSLQGFSRTLSRSSAVFRRRRQLRAPPLTRSDASSRPAADLRPLFPVLPSSFEAAEDEEARRRNRDVNIPLFSEVIDKRAAIASRDDETRAKDRSSRKLTVQERIDLLRDKDSEALDIGLFAGYDMSYGCIINASNAVTIATIAGETCVVSANVWTFKGGTLYPISVKKQLRAQEIAMENRLPCVYLVDSGGGLPSSASELSVYLLLLLLLCV